MCHCIRIVWLKITKLCSTDLNGEENLIQEFQRKLALGLCVGSNNVIKNPDFLQSQFMT